MHDLDELQRLPPHRKLEIVTLLWDDLASEAGLTLPPGELAEMERRREELQNDPSIAIDADEVWRRADGG